ncbi:MAG: nucleotidyltransferase domain-containing protein [Rhizomicrobium sp.]
MNRDSILARLKENEPALRARGVRHAALFGSRARGDNRADSDIDILIDIESDAVQNVYEYVALKSFIASMFDEPVDVIGREFLKPLVKPPAESEAVYAF